MTSDQSKLVSDLHGKIAGQRNCQRADVTVGEVLQLINLLRQADRAADVAQATLNRVLTRAAEENLESLLEPAEQQSIQFDDTLRLAADA